MNWLSLTVLIFVVCFGFVILFGAPYLPTKKDQIRVALNLLNLKSGQSFIELGCGDGRVLKAAAKNGLRVTGYELNPILVVVAKIVTFSHRKQITIIWGNYWHKKWPEADGIYCFLLDKYMARLDQKISKDYSNPVRLASYAFKIPNKKPVRTDQGVFLYEYK
ncbi:MAG TPA: methyltransferase domain-containing protein [Candidatus Saccharibacteria bacterium]|nr:methyltransferase domain-containing protein [Candidatus Saccharibacteria bacterium]